MASAEDSTHSSQNPPIHTVPPTLKAKDPPIADTMSAAGDSQNSAKTSASNKRERVIKTALPEPEAGQLQSVTMSKTPPGYIGSDNEGGDVLIRSKKKVRIAKLVAYQEMML